MGSGWLPSEGGKLSIGLKGNGGIGMCNSWNRLDFMLKYGLTVSVRNQLNPMEIYFIHSFAFLYTLRNNQLTGSCCI